MAQRDLEIVLKARDEASKEIEKVSSATSNWGGTIKSLAIGATALYAGKKLVDFATESFNAFAEAEVEMTKFNATMDTMVGKTLTFETGQKSVSTALKLTGADAEVVTRKMEDYKIAIKEQEMKLADLSTQFNKNKMTQGEYTLATTKAKKNIDDYKFAIDQLSVKLTETESTETAITKTISITAKEVENARKKFIEAGEATIKLGFDNEKTTNMMSRFFQATGSSSEALKMNAIAMDLARAKGIDYETASKQVLLVQAGNVKVLKEFGIAVTDNMTPLQAMGALQKNVAGQAEAYAKTSQGQMEILSGNWGELKESIGATLAESLTPFIGEMTKFIQDPMFKEVLMSLAQLFGITLKGAIDGAKWAFKAWLDMGEFVYKWLEKLYNFILDSTAWRVMSESIQWVIDKVNALISAIERLNILQNAKKAFNATTDWLSDKMVPYMANGGIVNSPTLAMIGEAGPEAVIPLSKMGGMGGGVTVIVNGDVSGTELIERVKQGIMSQLRMDTKLSF